MEQAPWGNQVLQNRRQGGKIVSSRPRRGNFEDRQANRSSEVAAALFAGNERDRARRNGNGYVSDGGRHRTNRRFMPFTDINKTASRSRAKFHRKRRDIARLSSLAPPDIFSWIRPYPRSAFSLLFSTRQDRRLRRRARDFDKIAYARPRSCNKNSDKPDLLRREGKLRITRESGDRWLKFGSNYSSCCFCSFCSGIVDFRMDNLSHKNIIVSNYLEGNLFPGYENVVSIF